MTRNTRIADRRWLRRAVLAVALALFVLWAVTPLAAAFHDAYGFGVEMPWVQLLISEGVIRLSCSAQHGGFSAHWEIESSGLELPLFDYYAIRQQPGGIVYRVLWVRLAALVVLAWAATALIYRRQIVALFARLLWIDVPPNHCQNCGYNLTGNTSGVCPECGEKV